MIQVGDKIPQVTLIEKQSEEVKTRDLFAGKLGVLLGMPGATWCDLRCTPRLTFTIAACFLAPLARRRVHAGLHQGTSLESARCCAELPWRGRPYACDALLQKTHLPGYINHADELRAAGVQEIAVCCVNDPWVMSAWAKDMGTEAKGIRMLADPRCEFSQALGCTQDDTAKLGNVRSRRYSMVRSADLPGTRTCKAHVSSDAGADCAGQRGQVPQRGEAGANCACCLPRRDALALVLTCMHRHRRSLVCRW
jgi:peroxiredoxin